ncbi:SPP1 family predicted phage head-tail adaptor [Paenibacillus turicensis]|uniref:SPP1 family predicted phage head-tail adaptor n=1 Tax=Paenibacillus turicensis TaxID=160487 RepID=A0ABS4FWX4_9BACL|nr:SPP1 family predicted phage head-tail adaptor [Paenibacillus turicensis]
MIQSKQTTTDDEGISTTEWKEWMPLWASRKPLTTRWREVFKADGLNVDKMVQLEIRYRTGITPDMRIIHGKKLVDEVEVDRIYDIKAVLDDIKGDGTETVIMALERDNG